MEPNIISPESIHAYLVKNYVTIEHLCRSAKLDEKELRMLILEGSAPGSSYLFGLSCIVTSSFADRPFESSGEKIEFYSPTSLDWILRAREHDPKNRPEEIYQHFVKTFADALVQEEAWMFGFGEVFDGTSLNHDRFKKFAAETWGHHLKGIFGICIKGPITSQTIVRKAIATYKVASLTDNGAAKSIEPQKMELLISAMRSFDDIVSHFAPHDWSNSSRKRLFDDLVPRYELQHEFPNFRVAVSSD